MTGAALPETSPATPEQLAARYVWWQVAARAIWGEEAFRQALRDAVPGALDERSWVFWHRHYGLEVPPLPRRVFG